MTFPMAIDYFTTGGGTELVLAFNYLAAFVNSSLMASMARIVIVISVIVLAFKAAFGDTKGILKWFVVASIVWLGFVEVKRTVVINDSTNPFLANRVIDNVPWAVAFFGGQISEVGRIVSDQATAFSSLPQAATYQENGFLFGASLLSQTTRFRVVNDKLSASLTNFLEQCILYGTLLQHTDFEVVANSDDIAGIIPSQLSSAQTFVSITESGGTVTTQSEECAAGYPGLLDRIDDDVDRVLAREARKQFPASEFTDAEAQARYTNKLEAFQNVMIGSAVSARDRLRQGMMIAALDESVGRFLASSGNAAAMQHYQAAKAEAQSFASKNQAGLLAAKFVPLAKIVFEVLYVTFFPIAAVLMMTPFWPAVLKGYFGGFVWLASWEAVSVPLHNMAIREYAQTYSGASGFINSAGVRENVISYANHLGIRAVEQDIASTAGYFLVFAPILAGGLVFGANRLASAATSSISATQGAANETAREATTGSIGINNVSMDTARNNKWSTSSEVDSGRLTSYLGSGGVYTRNADGSEAFSSGSALTTGALRFGYTNEMREAMTQRLEQAQIAASEHQSSFTNGVSTTTRSMTDFMQNRTQGGSVSNGVTVSDGAGMTDGVRQSIGTMQQFANDNGVNLQTVLNASLAGRAGATTPSGAASFNLGVEGSASSISNERFSEVARASQDAGVSRAFDDIYKAMHNDTSSNSQSYGASSSNGTSVSLDDISSSYETFSQSQRQVQTLSNAIEMSKSEGFTFSGEGLTAFTAYLGTVYSHLPPAERIEKIDEIIQNKSWTYDPEAMQHATTFLTGAANAQGFSATALGGSVAFPESNPGGTGGSTAGSGFQNSWSPSALGPNGDRGAEVQRRFFDEAAVTSSIADGHVETEAGMRDRQNQVEEIGAARIDALDSSRGRRSDAVSTNAEQLEEEIEPAANRGAATAVADRVRRGLE